ncbi:hypothetical protein L2E82_02283 [Cichorium intybus]|uniref:Uncharacterized protein n=1 Tax=Cichorium intybus TaxID=13427 RepID=A0ACB9H1W1_CICIN|nr:hypothetical protein L2E82_02283 [Cichorium intybus]
MPAVSDVHGASDSSRAGDSSSFTEPSVSPLCEERCLLRHLVLSSQPWCFVLHQQHSTPEPSAIVTSTIARKYWNMRYDDLLNYVQKVNKKEFQTIKFYNFTFLV